MVSLLWNVLVPVCMRLHRTADHIPHRDDFKHNTSEVAIPVSVAGYRLETTRRQADAVPQERGNQRTCASALVRAGRHAHSTAFFRSRGVGTKHAKQVAPHSVSILLESRCWHLAL